MSVDHKFQVEFSYDPTQNGRQDSIVMSSLKNFKSDVLKIDKSEEDYRCVTLGLSSDIANGVNLLNALKEAAKLVGEKNVKLSAVVYTVGKNIEMTTDVHNLELLKDVKNFATNAANKTGSDMVHFNGGFGLNFNRVKEFEEFNESHKDELSKFTERGLKINHTTNRSELYDINNYVNIRSIKISR